MTDPEVRRGKSVAGGHGRCGRRGVSVERVDVGQQCAHDRWNTGTHVLGRQAREMATTHNEDMPRLLPPHRRSKVKVGGGGMRSTERFHF